MVKQTLGNLWCKYAYHTIRLIELYHDNTYYTRRIGFWGDYGDDSIPFIGVMDDVFSGETPDVYEAYRDFNVILIMDKKNKNKVIITFYL